MFRSRQPNSYAILPRTNRWWCYLISSVQVSSRLEEGVFQFQCKPGMLSLRHTHLPKDHVLIRRPLEHVVLPIMQALTTLKVILAVSVT